jgi:hypothetical protein
MSKSLPFHIQPLAFTVLLAFLVLMLAPSAVAQTVTVQTPFDTETVPNPVPIIASTDTAADRIEIWVNGSKVDEQSGTSYKGALTLSTGTDRFVVIAAQGTNTILAETVESITVTATPNVLGSLDVSFPTNKQVSGNGCTNGLPTTFSVTADTTHTVDNQSAKFSVAQSGSGMYNCVYWFLTHNSPGHVVQYVKYHFKLYIPSGQPSGDSKEPIQAIEFEVQQDFNNTVYNFAWQDQYRGCGTSCTWNVYNMSTHAWENTDIPATAFTHDAWHDIVAEFHVDSSGTIWHDALTIDGTRNVPTIHNSHSSVPKTVGATLNNAFQLDMDQYDDSYTVYVDTMDVTYTP